MVIDYYFTNEACEYFYGKWKPFYADCVLYFQTLTYYKLNSLTCYTVQIII